MWLCDVAEKNRIMHVPDNYMWSPGKPGDFFIPYGNFKLPQRHGRNTIRFPCFCVASLLPKAKIITVSMISLSAHLPWYLQ